MAKLRGYNSTKIAVIQTSLVNIENYIKSGDIELALTYIKVLKEQVPKIIKN